MKTNELDPIITRTPACVMLGGIDRGTLLAWERSGRLPPPIRLSARVIGWRRSTLEKFIAGCAMEDATR